MNNSGGAETSVTGPARVIGGKYGFFYESRFDVFFICSFRIQNFDGNVTIYRVPVVGVEEWLVDHRNPDHITHFG
jgi:hypothetical protein